jgi:hypothetical protein
MDLKKNELLPGSQSASCCFPFVKNHNSWTGVFLSVNAGDEEDNIVKLPLHDQNNVRFGP